MSKPTRIARPRSREQIEELAWKARESLGLGPLDRVPVAKILENVLPVMIEQYEFRVVEPGALGAAEAITDVARPIITFDLATYNALLRDDYRARMTGIHELGHLLLHTGQTGMAFMPRKDSSVDLERQADMFASAFLMPEFAFREMTSIRAVIKRFGVSRDAACYRARTLRMPWLISGKPAPTRNKKKGHGMNRAP